MINYGIEYICSLTMKIWLNIKSQYFPRNAGTYLRDIYKDSFSSNKPSINN